MRVNGQQVTKNLTVKKACFDLLNLNYQNMLFILFICIATVMTTN